MKTLIKRLELSDFPSTDGKCFDCISAFKRIGYVLSGDNYSSGALDVAMSEIGWLWRKAGNSTSFGTAAEVLSTYGGGACISRTSRTTDLSRGGGVNGSMLTIHQLPRSTSEERQTSYDRCNPAKHGYLHDFKRRLQLVRCFFYVEDWLSKSDNNSEKLLEDTVLLSSRRVA